MKTKRTSIYDAIGRIANDRKVSVAIKKGLVFFVRDRMLSLSVKEHRKGLTKNEAIEFTEAHKCLNTYLRYAGKKPMPKLPKLRMI